MEYPSETDLVAGCVVVDWNRMAHCRIYWWVPLVVTAMNLCAPQRTGFLDHRNDFGFSGSTLCSKTILRWNVEKTALFWMARLRQHRFACPTLCVDARIARILDSGKPSFQRDHWRFQIPIIPPLLIYFVAWWACLEGTAGRRTTRFTHIAVIHTDMTVL
jgi:hypothetical protein